MQNFIVLGIIPGTNVQINFTAWLLLCFGICISSYVLHERHAIKAWALSHYVAHRIKQLPIASSVLGFTTLKNS